MYKFRYGEGKYIKVSTSRYCINKVVDPGGSTWQFPWPNTVRPVSN